MVLKNTVLYTLLFFVLTAFSPTQQEISDRVARYIEGGNAKGLSTYFAESVDVKIENNQSVYSKAQATIVVQNFFKKYTPQSFTFMHKGVSQRGKEYHIGRLKTSSTDFIVTFHLKQSGNTYLIQQFYIEEA